MERELEQVALHCLLGWDGGEATEPLDSPFPQGPAWTPPLQPHSGGGGPPIVLGTKMAPGKGKALCVLE